MLIEAVIGDITDADTDVVVNAANAGLLGGGGVDGAIHRAGGPQILAECRSLRATTHRDGLGPGQAVATGAGRLPATWVVHTVGPKRWEHDDGGVDVLASCHTSSLDVAASLGARSVSFPAISCGAYGWDPADAAPVAVAAVRGWAAAHPIAGVTTVRFVLVDADTHAAFAAAVAAADRAEGRMSR